MLWVRFASSTEGKPPSLHAARCGRDCKRTRFTAAPPKTEIFRKESRLKKPIHCPSGEKKGSPPPSVAGRTVALDSLSNRVASEVVLPLRTGYTMRDC